MHGVTGNPGHTAMCIFKAVKCYRYINEFFLDPGAGKEVNHINFSSVKQCRLEKYEASTFSIKYITRGTEHYFLEGKKFSVGAGKFLVVNNGQPLDVLINSEQHVNSFCIHVDTKLVGDVYQSLLHKDQNILNDSSAGMLPGFQPLIYSENENQLGVWLRQVVKSFDQATGELDHNASSFFIELASRMIELQHRLPGSASDLKVLKNSTRRELVARLDIAKDCMDAAGGTELAIEEIAKAALFSPSHFYRVFKNFYGITPHQYQLRVKMEKADRLLRSKKFSVTEVAMECGYPDLPSFTHQYKKFFKMPPSKILED